MKKTKKEKTRLDKRARLFAKQRKERGWDDSDTWSLDWTIAKFILPRLKRFREIDAGFPGGETSESWNKKLDQMIAAFEIYANGGWNINKDNWKIAKRGLMLFGKWYGDLWW